MSSRLADRLSAARHRRFVGRSAEKQLFQTALGAAEPPFYVLYVFGPGGVGKSSLLSEYSALAKQQGARAINVDARNVEPAPDSFLASLTIALGLPLGQSPVDHLLADSKQTVLLIDTYEMLTSIEVWLRDVFLPQLPSNALVIVASRNPPSQGWRADPGWNSLLRVLPLRNLAPEESRALLNMRTVPANEHDQIIEFTHGHPLAVSLVADVLDQQPDMHFVPEAVPDIVRTLLERLVQEAPTTDHRVALEACALVRHMNEALLSQMLLKPNAHDLFEWLRGLSFMDAGRYGIFPHDLVRDTIAADLRWRNPVWYTELHTRARLFFREQLNQTTGQNQRRMLTELVFLHRENAVVRQFIEFAVNETVWSDLARPEDLVMLVEMVRKHEGEDSARLASFWLERQPRAATVVRNSQQRAIGFLLNLALTDATQEEIALDPATRTAWGYLQQTAPLQPGEQAIYFRYWMDIETYQGISTTQSRIFLNMAQQYLSTPGLAYTILPCANPDFYAAPFHYADLTRIVELDFSVGNTHYGVYGHDWRVTPQARWLELLAEREIAMAAAMPQQQIVKPPLSQPVVVLSEPEFAEAVRDALRHFTRADELRSNPLLRSRLVVGRAGANASTLARATALQALLKEVIALLQSNPRQAKLHRAIHHTYIQPAATQELAAELLDLPFSTYRRHLKEGIENITETLWNHELSTLAD